jgi:flavodoxin
MKALVASESMYGDTRAVAEAVAEGLSRFTEVSVHPVHDAGDPPHSTPGSIAPQRSPGRRPAG